MGGERKVNILAEQERRCTTIGRQSKIIAMITEDRRGGGLCSVLCIRMKSKRKANYTHTQTTNFSPRQQSLRCTTH